MGPPPTLLCAVTDDDCRHDVIVTGRALAAAGRMRLRAVHVRADRDPAEAGRRLLRECGVAEDEALVATGEAVTEIDRLAIELDAELVVVGGRGLGAVAGALLGSVSRGLARTGERPVLIARPDVLPSLGGPVVCAVDVDDEGHRALAAYAARLAALLDRSLVLAHVSGLEPLAAAAGPVPAAMAVVAVGEQQTQARRALAELDDVLEAEDVETVVLEGLPVAQRIEHFASGRRADLVVVGCRGGGLVRTALQGSVSLDLARHGRRPLVVVPPA